jgi:hypothetical protein
MNDFFNAIMQDVLGWAMDRALDAIWSHWLARWALGAGETLKGRLEARRRASVRLPSAESAGELREQVRDLPQEPQIQEQPGYGYQPGFQQPQQWQQQPWN